MIPIRTKRNSRPVTVDAHADRRETKQLLRYVWMADDARRLLLACERNGIPVAGITRIHLSPDKFGQREFIPIDQVQP